MDQGQQNEPRKVARPTFSCQDEGLCPSSGPDKKMWPWQLFLAHFVGPGPFLASGQLSLVVRGGRDNERFSKFATLFEKGAFLSIWSKIGLSGAEISTIKRRAPKNDAESRWNFVKWTNGDLILTRKLGWIWGDLGWF